MLMKFLFALLICVSSLGAQDAISNKAAFGLHFQQYPTGSIPGVSLTLPLRQKHSLQIRVGYNIVYHGDAGAHENEEGGGFGFSPAYLFALKDAKQGVYLGGRIDFWFNGIDWMDNIGQANETSGKTDIVVVQPTALLGYRLPLGDNFVLTPELAFGFEINAIQDGADVGQGPILLAGITFARRF